MKQEIIYNKYKEISNSSYKFDLKPKNIFNNYAEKKSEAKIKYRKLILFYKILLKTKFLKCRIIFKKSRKFCIL